jgi:4-hydroxybenzoate polyprenyltransferase
MAQYLTKAQRVMLVKFLAYLGLVRWYNLLLVALAQYLAALFILNPEKPALETLADPGLHCLVLSCGWMIAGGYLINAFYDLEKDMANQPRKLIIGRIISKSFALNTYFLLNFMAMLGAMLIGWRAVLFLAVFSFLLWLYSHKLKKITFLGNLTATFLSVCSFFAVCVYYMQVNHFIVLYVLFLVISELIREIVKDMEAIKGDIIYGYRTVPVALGIPATKKLLYLLMLSSLVPVSIIFMLQGWSAVMLFFLGALSLMIASMFLLRNAAERKDYTRINNVLKAIIITGVLSICLL